MMNKNSELELSCKVMKKVLITILLLNLFVVKQAFASFSLLDLVSLNSQLSNNAILCIHQDLYGFMWFGTYDGLNLYDGKKVTTFRYEINNPNSLSGNTIHNIQAAEDGYLWISTQRGLNKFSLKERQSVETYMQYKRVDLIAVDKNGNSWMINKDNYLLFYDSSIKKMWEIPAEGIQLSEIRSMFADKAGRICLILKDARLQYLTLSDMPARKEAPYALSVSEVSFHNEEIMQVFYEDGQVYFIDKYHNLFVYDSFKHMKILLRNISDMVAQYGLVSSLRLFQNEVYLAFMHSGLLKFDASTHDKKPELINMTVGIFGLLKDRFQEAVWVGTDGLGVELYCSEKNNFGNILLSNLPFVAKRPVRAFYTDEENTLWVGTKGDGIIRIKDYASFKNSKIPAENIQHFIGMHENPVYSFVRSRFNKDDLWIGTDGNLSYYSYKENKVYPVKERAGQLPAIANVHSFCEVNDSTLWLSSRGLYKVVIDKTKHPYEIKRKECYPFLRDNVWINDEFYSMIYNGGSVLFLGSRGGYGVSRFNINDSTSTSVLTNVAIGDVISLYIDEDSTLYVGTSSGLIQVSGDDGKAKDKIKQFTREDGILNDMIHGILEDNFGIIWLSTSKGLVKYNPRNGAFFNVKSMHIGVSEFSDDAYWKCPITGRLFFGGVNGLVWIEPEMEQTINTYEPDLLFTELDCSGSKKTLYEYNENTHKVLKLKSNQNTFQLTFAVLDYINGDNYDYFYLLDNYNDQWISLKKENKIRFTNLLPGDYTLKVKYRNDVVSADDKVYTLRITVLPPWYLSTVAFLIYSLLFAASLVLAAFYVRRKFAQKQQALARRLKEEQKEKMYESKLNFFANVTHELYTPLTLINGAVDQIQKGEVNQNTQKYLSVLHNNVLSLNELIQEILDVRKIEEADVRLSVLKNVCLSEIFDKLLTSFSVLAGQNKVELITSIPDNLYWNTDSKGFRKIISNLLSNALKYTPVGGFVKLTVTAEDNALKIVVRNSGKGIEPGKLSSVFNRDCILEETDVNANNQMTARNGLGLYICYSIVKMLKGEITANSVVNEYTEFVVTLPKLSLDEVLDTDEQPVAEFAAEPSAEPDGKPVVKSDVESVEKPTADVPGENNAEKVSKIDVNSVVEVSVPHVLIVDDNKDIVELVADLLSPYCQPLKAFSVKEALELLKKQTPSLVITDIMMPEIDGFSFIRMLREDKYCKRLPIIALSAKTDNLDQVKGYELGVDAYITKPFSSDVLVSVVCRFLTNKVEMKNYYDSVDSSFEYIHGKLLHQKDKKFIEDVLEIIKKNISNSELGPELIANEMKTSTRNLYRQMKKIIEISPTELVKDYKLSYAAKLLMTTNLSVKEIIYKVGITNKSYFYNEFFKKYQLSPKQYKGAKTENEE